MCRSNENSLVPDGERTNNEEEGAISNLAPMHLGRLPGRLI
jgi:hypothetical protein